MPIFAALVMAGFSFLGWGEVLAVAAPDVLDVDGLFEVDDGLQGVRSHHLPRDLQSVLTSWMVFEMWSWFLCLTLLCCCGSLGICGDKWSNMPGLPNCFSRSSFQESLV